MQSWDTVKTGPTQPYPNQSMPPMQPMSPPGHNLYGQPPPMHPMSPPGHNPYGPSPPMQSMGPPGPQLNAPPTQMQPMGQPGQHLNAAPAPLQSMGPPSHLQNVPPPQMPMGQPGHHLNGPQMPMQPMGQPGHHLNGPQAPMQPMGQPGHHLNGPQTPMQSMAPPGHHPYGPPPSMHYQPQRQMKLDQHAMPSAAQLINDEIQIYKKTDRQLKFTAPASLPPLVTTLESHQLKMSLQDAGCVRPCHMRSTIYQVPVSKDLLETSNLEFSVVIKPFDEGEVEGKFYTPLSPSEIVRCNRCKAYINPFSRNSQCCICSFSIQGLQELDQRPELQLGSYEFRVSPEYYRNAIAETRRPHIIFAIEMTASSRHLVHYISKNLANVIKTHFPTDFLYSASLSPLVGFVTYNSKITLYDVMNGGHAYVISDMTSSSDCASTSVFLVDPAENFEEIEKFLASLAEVSDELAEQEQQTVLGPVIEAALQTCLFDTSNHFQSEKKKPPNQKVVPTGKIIMLHSSLPTFGDESTPGRLGAKRNIDDLKRQLGTENESKALAPEGKYYTNLAQKCINDYASGVELFLFPPSPRAYLNVSTIGALSKLTGTGVINKYHISSLDNFIQDLKISLKSTMGFDASMRVRTSTGISPVAYIGNFNNAVGSNLEMSAVNTSSNFVVQMKYDDKLPENELVVVQFAMIYTSICGERRVRVHNLALSTCTVLNDLYKSACCDTLVNVLLRDAVEKLRAGSLTPKAVKEQLTSRVINILAAYRKHCTENQANSTSQLILPEGLKLLPVYLCGALKCDAIDGGAEMFPDDKILAQMNLIGALPSSSQATIYPRMYSIEACEADDEENAYGLSPVLTRCYNLAIEEARGQCYVLENGYYLFIYFPNTELGQNFLASVYGKRKDDPDIIWEFRDRESNESKFLEELIGQIVIERRRALRISVVRQGRDKMEHVFKTFLYEDKKRPEGTMASKIENASYVDILCYLHAEIRSKLSQ